MFAMLLLGLGQSATPGYNPIDLVELYRTYHLPEPPLQAMPVVCTSRFSSPILGFQVQGKGIHPVFWPWQPLTGFQNYDVERIEPAIPGGVRGVEADWTLWPTVALLESRGNGPLAGALTRAALSPTNPWSSDYRNPRESMRKAAWGYWRRVAIEESRSRQPIRNWLSTLPRLDGRPLDHDERSFLDDLDASARSHDPTSESSRYDRLIDELITARGEALSDQKYGPWSKELKARLATPVVQLWEAGFDAVPALFRHLDDRRITQLGTTSHLDHPFYHRICDIAADIIEMNLDLGNGYYACDYRDEPRTSGRTSPDDRIFKTKSLWSKWLAKKNTGERRFLLDQMKELDHDEKGALNHISTQGARAYPLRVLALKYRPQLVEFYRHVRYEEEGEQILEALKMHPPRHMSDPSQD